MFILYNKKHYILFLTNDSISKKDNASEKVIGLLVNNQVLYEEQVISNDLVIEDVSWFIEKMLTVHLTVDEKIRC